jgi:serine/threonine protein kinase
MAKLVNVGEPAHDAERQAFRLLEENLPDSYTVYTNAWVVEAGGAIYEVDAVVVAPHGIYVVELKAYRGHIKGNDHDWYVPQPIPSPLRLNRKTAQVLAGELKRKSYQASSRWVDHFVFLTHTTDIAISGLASAGRVHTRKTIFHALQDAEGFTRRSGRASVPAVDEHTRKTVYELLRGVDPGQRPPRRIRDWDLLEPLDRTDTFVEYRARHRISHKEAVLRVYPFDPLADQAALRPIEERCKWEAQVLAKIGRHRFILDADPAFDERGGICVPLEAFEGLSLLTWVEKYARKSGGVDSLRARARIFEKVAEAISHAHAQGVVHRLLRPEVIRVQDRADDPDLRVTGFDLAKQLNSKQTVMISTFSDDRLRWAAPEVAQGFSNATPHSDQFGLGAILGLLLTGRPLFESTVDLIRRGGIVPHLRDANGAIPQSLDDAVHRMLALRPADRFPNLEEAVAAVADSLAGRTRASPPPRLDPENLPAGSRLGPDYEIRGRLGAGGMATVYAALHLVSGSIRALKVARRNAKAEDALQAEYRALQALDHPKIVRVIDLTSALVPDHKVLVMDRVKGDPLSRWLEANPSPDRETLRRYAEDLLSALAYLETQGLTHKDFKPDNLVVGDQGLTVIDFSLVEEPADSLLVGTALYRDPSLKVWDAAADRYGAALCLFELYAGRHAFDGNAPAPGENPRVEEGDFDQPGLAAFFRRALDPRREARFPSAVAMREGFLAALGQKQVPTTGSLLDLPKDDPELPLSATSLSATAVANLRRAGVHTQGELVALTAEQLRGVSGLGKKKRKEIAEFQEALRRRGIRGPERAAAVRLPIFPSLVGDQTDVHRLGLPAALAEALVRAGLGTVDRVAGSTREDLKTAAEIGGQKLVQLVEALDAYADRGEDRGIPVTLDDVWVRATSNLTGRQPEILEASFGIRGELLTQQQIGERLDGMGQGEVSRQLRRALDTIHRPAFDGLVELLEIQLENAGGVLTVDEVVRSFEERWPASEDLHTAGLVRLLVRLHATRIHVVAHPNDDGPELLVVPGVTRETLDGFCRAARQLARPRPAGAGGEAGVWTEPEAARRTLRTTFPEYPLDPLSLATRFLPDLRLTEAGELFEAPVGEREAIAYVLRRERMPLTTEELFRAMERAFGDAVLLPVPARLHELLEAFPQCRLEGDRIVPVEGRSVVLARPEADPLPPELRGVAKPPEVVAGELLRSAAEGHRRFREVVTPPERHLEIGPSVARALGDGAVWVSFESELLERMEPEFESYDRAERFKAMRPKLRRAALSLLDELIERHGWSGSRVVVGDTGILGLCDATDLPRLLYDRVSGSDLGFWVLVLPGVVQKRQPLFNEQAPVFHVDGIVLPLEKPIPQG